MKLLLPCVIAALAFLTPIAQARTVLVTDANNEKAVTLAPGDTLVVRLAANVTTGYSWNVVYDPTGPLTLSGKPRYVETPHAPGIVGSGGTSEFRFAVPRSADGTAWLRLLNLQPFMPGVKDAQLWEIHYTINPPAKAAK